MLEYRSRVSLWAGRGSLRAWVSVRGGRGGEGQQGRASPAVQANAEVLAQRACLRGAFSPGAALCAASPQRLPGHATRGGVARRCSARRMARRRAFGPEACATQGTARYASLHSPRTALISARRWQVTAGQRCDRRPPRSRRTPQLRATGCPGVHVVGPAQSSPLLYQSNVVKQNKDPSCSKC